MLDPSGLIHMGGRVYDSNIGRFMSADILVQDPSDSQSFNRYSYVGNRPLSIVDPTGYCGGPLYPGGIVSPCHDDDSSGGYFTYPSGGGMSGPTPWDLYMAAGAVVANAWEPISQFAEGTFDQSLEDLADQVWNTAPGDIMPYASPTLPSFADQYGPRQSKLGAPNSSAEKNGRTYGSMLLPLVTKSPGGAAKAAKAAEKGLETVFKTDHYTKRLESAGVNVAKAEAAVAKEVNAVRSNMATNSDAVGRLQVDGVLVEYRARLLENGTINIGTLFPVK